ncbi:hypothetical protein WJX73_000192 [Symbiochloris irregularis]|uniref:Uncharacterized protein n=1 Tax=Symbiochloris irregularis TaxID=706552 RepID=A0AAW1NP39_9CHLO
MPARRKLTASQLIHAEAVSGALAVVTFLLAALNISVEVTRVLILLSLDAADAVCNGILRFLRSAVERLEEANEEITGPQPGAERHSRAYSGSEPRRSLSTGVGFIPGMRQAHLEEDVGTAVRRTLSAGVSFPLPSNRPDPTAIRAVRKQPSQVQTVHADLQQEVQGSISRGPSGASDTQHPDTQGAPGVSDGEGQYDDVANIWNNSTAIVPWNYLDPRAYKQPGDDVQGFVDQAAVRRDSLFNEIINNDDSEYKSSSGDGESMTAVSIDRRDEELAAIPDADTEDAFSAADPHNSSDDHHSVSHAWTTVGNWLNGLDAGDVTLERPSSS